MRYLDIMQYSLKKTVVCPTLQVLSDVFCQEKRTCCIQKWYGRPICWIGSPESAQVVSGENLSLSKSAGRIPRRTHGNHLFHLPSSAMALHVVLTNLVVPGSDFFRKLGSRMGGLSSNTTVSYLPPPGMLKQYLPYGPRHAGHKRSYTAALMISAHHLSMVNAS